MNFLALAHEVMAQRERDGVRGLDREWSRFRCHIEPAAFAANDVAAITSPEIRTWLRTMAEKPALGYGPHRKLSRQTVSRSLSLVSAVFTEAVERELIEQNPCMGVKSRKRVDESDTREKWAYLTLDEQRAISACESIPRSDKLLILFAIHTGLRQGEQYHLELADLVTEGPDPHVVVRIGSWSKDGKKLPPKSGKKRVVPLLPPALEVAKEWQAQLETYAPYNDDGSEGCHSTDLVKRPRANEAHPPHVSSEEQKALAELEVVNAEAQAALDDARRKWPALFKERVAKMKTLMGEDPAVPHHTCTLTATTVDGRPPPPCPGCVVVMPGESPIGPNAVVTNLDAIRDLSGRPRADSALPWQEAHAGNTDPVIAIMGLKTIAELSPDEWSREAAKRALAGSYVLGAPGPRTDSPSPECGHPFHRRLGSPDQIWCSDCGALWWTPAGEKKGRWQLPRIYKAETGDRGEKLASADDGREVKRREAQPAEVAGSSASPSASPATSHCGAPAVGGPCTRDKGHLSPAHWHVGEGFEAASRTDKALRDVANDLIDAIATPKGRDFRHAWEAACVLFGRFGSEPALLQEIQNSEREACVALVTKQASIRRMRAQSIVDDGDRADGEAQSDDIEREEGAAELLEYVAARLRQCPETAEKP